MLKNDDTKLYRNEEEFNGHEETSAHTLQNLHMENNMEMVPIRSMLSFLTIILFTLMCLFYRKIYRVLKWYAVNYEYKFFLEVTTPSSPFWWPQGQGHYHSNEWGSIPVQM